MKLPKFKVRTLLIIVASIALLLEVLGFGRLSRHYAAEASKAAELERSSLQIASDSAVSVVESRIEADRIATENPARATSLRLNAERLTRGITFRRDLAARAAKAKVAFERASSHPWESAPKADDRLFATPLPD